MKNGGTFYFLSSMVGFAVGMIVGGIVSAVDFKDLLHDAGIERLKPHEIRVDGKITTNWVEIVWRNDSKCIENPNLHGGSEK